jgi:hypothetical protein
MHQRIKLAAGLGYGSLLCSFSVWIEAVVQFALRSPLYVPPPWRWVATLVLSMVLAISAAIRGPRRWALAALCPLGTLLLLDYIIGS